MKPVIGWFIPSLIEGSGGIREIFNKINALVDLGYECHAHVRQDDDASFIADQIERFYGGCRAVIHAGHQPDRPYDLNFATIWWSAETVSRLPGLKAYLIQDFEAYFNPMGDGYLLAEQSYRLGLTPITLGRWLPNFLHGRYGVRARHFDFCADTSTYRPLADAKKDPLSVCYIHQPEKPRRCANIGIPALALLKKLRPELTVYLYGSRSAPAVDFPHVNLGILKPAEINELYNRCTVGFCISASNPSRIPFEMMAAGLPVVDIHRDNNLYDFPDQGVLLARPDSSSLAGALAELLDDPARRARFSAYGARFMQPHPMSVEMEQFVAAVEALLAGAPAPAALPARLYHTAASLAA